MNAHRLVSLLIGKSFSNFHGKWPIFFIEYFILLIGGLMKVIVPDTKQR